MADNVTVANGGTGSNFNAATDEVAMNGGSAVHVQYVKLVDGTNGGTDNIVGTTAGGLYVVAHRDVVRISTASGGLTTASTSYTAGDQVGTEFTIANAARASGGTGTIVGVALVDAADIIGAFDVVFTRSSITPAADNAAYSISDADAVKIIGIAQLAGSLDIGGNRVAQMFNCAIPYDCAATSLFATLITRSAHTFFAATTDLQLIVTVERN